MRMVLGLVAVFVMAAVVRGDEGAAGGTPKEVQGAVAKCEEAVREAEGAYRKAVVAAKQQLVKEVQAQLQVAMKAGSVETVKALDAMKTELEGEIRFLEFKGAVVKVDARAWTKIGAVKKGQAYRFEAKGKWSMKASDPKGTCDADGVAGTNGAGALVGRINGKTIVMIGKSATVTVPEDGVMEIGPNDGEAFGDNGGFLMVRVEGVVH